MIVFHEKKKVTRKRLRKKGFLMGKPPYSMQMYAVKRNDYMEDEKIINALDYYCYYGQVNYYFMSKEYILFTYTIYNIEYIVIITLLNSHIPLINQVQYYPSIFLLIKKKKTKKKKWPSFFNAIIL